MADLASKLPLKRLESPIQKFTKVAVPTDLQRLQQHQHNIEKFQRLQQWDRLHQEHVNASRTVQQLRSNLREMEKLCGRVHDDDVEALQKLVQPIREQAVAATRDFLRLHAEAVGQIGPRVAPPTDLLTESSSCSDFDVGVASPRLIQTQLPVIPPEQNAAESWDSLEEELLELNGLVNQFSLIVHSQQEKIDSIEENVSAAAANVEEGARSLGKAARSGLAVLPVAGALVGGVLGGPLGLLAGFKLVGVAAAVGGGLIGFAGGNLIQKRSKERVALQLQQLDNTHED
ncbi:syntaxin-17 [Denticeps clupeoides]|uniref:syntaxin-17 n=1 Tax=Denticeps clupeoides TaxID=299321 RepID=UPI0010A46DA5|nr:syntaxin-17 [Denticeps clupeoides]XP_028836174.1 syntaxin-17 [Denticeps clupeoides]